MLDEKQLRRPEWVEGHWTELADSQKWCFPRPRVRFKPSFNPDGKIDVGGGNSFGPEFDANLDVLWGLTECTGYEQLRVKFETAVRLLKCNYDLTNEQLAELLVYEPDDPVSKGRFDAVSSIIRGQAPKPLADTSDVSTS
jgi:hypothetical protein